MPVLSAILARRGAAPSFLLLLYLVHVVWVAIGNSAVADEVGGHLDAGYLYWTTGVYSGGIANFPLAHLWNASLVAWLGRPHELFTDQSLLWFRIPNVLLGLGLGVLLYRFTRDLFDRTAALFALLLYAFSPNLLAHAGLATLDFPLAAFYFATVVALGAWLREPSWTRAVWLGLALGAACATKVQGLLLVPLVFALVAASAWFGGAARRRPHLSLLLAFGLAWVGVHAVYGRLPLQGGDWLPPLYQDALRFKLEHGRGALAELQVAYALGETSTTGWWWYFPFALLVKTPVTILIFAAVGAWRGPRFWAWTLLPAAWLLAVATQSSVNIGLRHVIAVLPFGLVLAGAGAAHMTRFRLGRRLILGLLTLLATHVWLQLPNALSFFSLAVGSSRRGHHLLVDSNLDWGQSDAALRRRVEALDRPVHIDPNPHHPVAGHVLVNANARAGIYGAGGASAYAWLDGLEPVGRVGHVWFEYDVPSDMNPAPPAPPTGKRNQLRPWDPRLTTAEIEDALGLVAPYLRGLAEAHGGIQNPRWQHLLGWTLAQSGQPNRALAGLRRWVTQHPSDQTGLGIGGEILVQWKLGVLHFVGTQYLTGESGRVEREAPFDDVAAAAHRVGLAPSMADLHRTLSQLLGGMGQRAEASEMMRRARALGLP